MKKFEIFDICADALSGGWKVGFFQGMMLILLGILILLIPQLLVAMVAAIFILLGVSFLGFAWTYKKFRDDYDNRFRVEIDDVF